MSKVQRRLVTAAVIVLVLILVLLITIWDTPPADV